ncbi:MAG: hypothetical protein AAF288_08960 [Planctomycetota bacterium]
MSDAPANAAPATPAPGKKQGLTPPTVLLGWGLGLVVVACGLAGGVNIALEEVGAIEPRSAFVAVLYVLYAVPVLLLLYGLCLCLAGAVRMGMYGRMGEAAPQTRRQLELLERISRRVMVSETGKRIAFRGEDIDLLRRTIQEDIEKQDFDAAMVLVGELSETFGYTEEAEKYREQLEVARQSQQEVKIRQAEAKLDEILARRDFDQASAEAKKLMRIFPESLEVQKLPQRVADAREGYKVDLERQFLEAAQREEVDRAMELMAELDQHLSDRDAEPFRETARGVIGKQRDNLGVQFKLAVHDREWLAAVRIGEQIIQQFPNTRMAAEVREHLDSLRRYAASQRAASSSGGGGANSPS